MTRAQPMPAAGDGGLPDVALSYPLPYERTLDGVLGLEMVRMGDGSAEGRVRITDDIKQRWGMVHGGALCALAEMLATEATIAAVHRTGVHAVGLSNHTSFLRPFRSGSVHAACVCQHRGSTTWVWEVSMTDDDGRLGALSRVTVALRASRGQAQAERRAER